MLNWVNRVTQGHIMELIAAFGVIVLIRIVMALIMTGIAEKKGYSKTGVFFACVIFGLCGWIVVAALPDKALRSKVDKILSAKHISINDEICIVPQRNDNSEPSGTVAYIPRESIKAEKTRKHAAKKNKKKPTAKKQRKNPTQHKAGRQEKRTLTKIVLSKKVTAKSFNEKTE